MRSPLLNGVFGTHFDKAVTFVVSRDSASQPPFALQVSSASFYSFSRVNAITLKEEIEWQRSEAKSYGNVTRLCQEDGTAISGETTRRPQIAIRQRPSVLARFSLKTLKKEPKREPSYHHYAHSTYLIYLSPGQFSYVIFAFLTIGY